LRQFGARAFDFVLVVQQGNIAHHLLPSALSGRDAGPLSFCSAWPVIDALNVSTTSPATSFRPSVCKPRPAPQTASAGPLHGPLAFDWPCDPDKRHDQ
jgi:hypothetical protein